MRKPTIPVIALSIQKDVQVVADLLKDGATDYIEKKHDTALENIYKSIMKILGYNDEG